MCKGSSKVNKAALPRRELYADVCILYNNSFGLGRRG
jgi:hypothetical protein